ncbi:hypothetical protein Clacol_007141 [Clathrus columnatus]|uniref:Uncharacterized protein n=1 Tax=Clathrus columnatus TaxID=1419009 RepID=A0AAV5ALU4_9AGAM|nr:hypothetical protein Clacol_007141 [Clathrus columnatus]
MSYSSQRGDAGQSPSSYYYSSSASPRSNVSNSPSYDGSEYYASPPKKSRKLTSSAQGQTSSYYPNDSSRGDMKYDPSSQRGGGHSSQPSTSRSGKGKAPANQQQQQQQQQQQPTKYRFVSVQSAGDLLKDITQAETKEHMEEDNDDGPFEHGPSEYPPRPYTGGEYASSPLRPKKATGKIPASNLDFLPVLEARFDRLETAIERYVEYRGQQALENSVLPRQQYPNSSSSTSKHRK